MKIFPFLRLFYFAILAILILFSACNTGPVPQGEKAGYYSFPVSETIVESGSIVSVINQKNIPDSFLNNIDIAVSGSVIRTYLFTGLFVIKRVILQNQDNAGVTYIPAYTNTFRWQGIIKTGNYHSNVFINFEAFGEENGANKKFILREASFDDVSLDFTDQFEIYQWQGGTYRDFPYLMGYFQLPGSRYRVMAVYNPSDVLYMKQQQIFYHPEQLFQILDEHDTVVAELKKGTYTIFDTLPEGERESIKKAISLMFAFKHATLLMKNDDGWGIRAGSDYVYPQ